MNRDVLVAGAVQVPLESLLIEYENAFWEAEGCLSYETAEFVAKRNAARERLSTAIAGLEQRLADVTSERDELRVAAGLALVHIRELREAWRRGVIDERDGQGGTRSNRNVDVEVSLRDALEVSK